MIFQQGFIGDVMSGESINAEYEGFTFTATIYKDDDMGEPWKEHDGHGPVREWRGRDSDKRPGERVLCAGGNYAYYYDFEAAVKIALKEGWGPPEPHEIIGESRRERACRAVEADFAYLKSWLDDEWYYVGVDVTVQKMGIELIGTFEHTTWGIESTAYEYLTDVANDLADDALATAKRKLIALCTMTQDAGG